MDYDHRPPNKRISELTMSLIRAFKSNLGSHANLLNAFDGSPIKVSTSVGLK